MCSSSTPLPLPREGRTPRWPTRLREVQAALRSEGGEAIRRQAFQEAWLLLLSALGRYLDLHSGRMGGVDREDLEDLSSEKSLELVRRLESGAWDLTGRAAGEIAGFLSTTARNGLVDLLRKRGRMVSVDEADPSRELPVRGPSGQQPDVPLQRRAFVAALKRCAGRLAGRDRTIWFFRVFYDLPSRDIANHPEVRLKPSHVDVILQRCRQALRKCMTRRGYEPQDMPPGTFAEMWASYRPPPLRTEEADE